MDKLVFDFIVLVVIFVICVLNVLDDFFDVLKLFMVVLVLVEEGIVLVIGVISKCNMMGEFYVLDVKVKFDMLEGVLKVFKLDILLIIGLVYFIYLFLSNLVN